MATGIRYLALLRGVNVGGRNLVKMGDLRARFEKLGFEEVATYIHSGNVLFRTPRQSGEELGRRLERELGRSLAMDLKVVVVTETQLRRVVQDAPRGFGGDADLCDVIFLRRPLTARRAIGLVETRDGVDRVWSGTRVLYFSRLAAEASRSRLSKIVARPEYKDMTIRSWVTTTKLLAMMESRGTGRG